MKPYKTPAIAGIFQILASVAILGGACVVAYALKDRNQDALWLALGMFTQSLLCFGIAAIIDSTAKAAHFAEISALKLAMMPNAMPSSRR